MCIRDRDGSVEVAERKRRAARWRSIGERKKKDFYNSLNNKTLEVVLEKVGQNALDGLTLFGTSREYASTKIIFPAESSKEGITNGTFDMKKLKLGQYVKAQAIKYDEDKLLCRLLSQEN